MAAKGITRDEIAQLLDLAESDPHEALSRLKSFETTYAQDVNFVDNDGAFLIEIGKALREPSVVQRGIGQIEALLMREADKGRARLLYNQGNGYSELYAIARSRPDFCFDPDNTPLVKAKSCYRQAIKAEAELDPLIRAELHVNYGNCLSHLGRSVEAITEYDKALSTDPDHPMAWGNLGQELEFYAGIANNWMFVQGARDYLQRALGSSRLEKRGGAAARDCFKGLLDRVEGILAKANLPISSKRGVGSADLKEKDEYVEFCTGHRLFLNFDIKHQSHYHPNDTIFFSLTTDINDDTTFPRLSRVVNEMKEQYAAARLLLFEAGARPYPSEECDQMTLYADNLDYAVYGVRPAKLKSAFQSAYNILDKIAFFINDYLNLRVKPDKVHFGRIWKRDHKSSLRPEIFAPDSCHLYALYDLSRDLASCGWFSHLREMRNSLTHRYLVLHTERIGWKKQADGSEYHALYGEFFLSAVNLFELVRAAVIYLIAFIKQEESKRRGKGIVAPMLVPWYQPFPGGSQSLRI